MPIFSILVPVKLLLNGLVTAGLVLNTYTGTMTDSKSLELYQIRAVALMQNGKVGMVYLPDGTPLPAVGTQFDCAGKCLVPVVSDSVAPDAVAPPPVLPLPVAP